MRPVLLALVLAAASVARAETTVPIVVVPFAGRCFDAAQLAEHVRAKVGELPVTVGAPVHGSRQEVRVSEHGDSVRVDVVARDARGRIVGSAHRLVPADADCPTTLDVAALIVVRAALPLNWREPDRKPPHVPPPSHTPPTIVTAPPPHPPAPEPQTPREPPPPTALPQTATATTPTTAPRAQTQPPSTPPPALSPSSPPAAPPPSTTVKIVRAPTEPGTIVLRTRGPAGRWVGELWADAYGAFGLGRNIDTAGGELAIGFRRGRFGAAARGAIENDWTARLQSSAGVIGVDVRRAAVALEAHADVGLRFGSLRFAAGPTLPLYMVRTSGVPRPSSSLVHSAAADVRILYHLDISRVFLQAGLACDVAFAREDLTVTGAGVVARTPWVTLGPLIAFGVNL
ncbi:MAG TPA: hypothetical protein VIA18_10840 [Polyangia bacterium]|nr:hypothetical protein [Polyangia bacterium]